MENDRFSLKKTIKSFGYALSGIQNLLQQERNAKIHLGLTLIALTLSFLLRIDKYEWMMVILCIALVFSAEAVNSSIERIANMVCNDVSPQIKTIKDLAAGAVLLSAISALLIGLIIFMPKILEILQISIFNIER